MNSSIDEIHTSHFSRVSYFQSLTFFHDEETKEIVLHTQHIKVKK